VNDGLQRIQPGLDEVPSNGIGLHDESADGSDNEDYEDNLRL